MRVGPTPVPMHAAPAMGLLRGHEGIGAEVDVQQRALGALEQHVLVLVEGRVDEQAGVADEGLEAFAVAEQLVGDLVGIQHADVVALQQEVLLLQRRPRSCAPGSWRPAGPARGCRCARTCRRSRGRCRGRSCRSCSCRAAARCTPIQEEVVRHDQMGVAADAQVVAADAPRSQSLDLAEQDVGVDHDAVADDAGLGLVEDAGRDEVELELLAVAHDRVAGVVAALVAHHHVGLLGEQVGDLAFAFVAPLGADHDRSRHVLTPHLVVGVTLTVRCRWRRPRRSQRGVIGAQDAARGDHAGGGRLDQASGDAGAVADGVQVLDRRLRPASSSSRAE